MGDRKGLQQFCIDIVRKGVWTTTQLVDTDKIVEPFPPHWPYICQELRKQIVYLMRNYCSTYTQGRIMEIFEDAAEAWKIQYARSVSCTASSSFSGCPPSHCPSSHCPSSSSPKVYPPCVECGEVRKNGRTVMVSETRAHVHHVCVKCVICENEQDDEGIYVLNGYGGSHLSCRKCSICHQAKDEDGNFMRGEIGGSHLSCRKCSICHQAKDEDGNFMRGEIGGSHSSCREKQKVYPPCVECGEVRKNGRTVMDSETRAHVHHECVKCKFCHHAQDKKGRYVMNGYNGSHLACRECFICRKTTDEKGRYVMNYEGGSQLGSHLACRECSICHQAKDEDGHFMRGEIGGSHSSCRKKLATGQAKKMVCRYEMKHFLQEVFHQ